MGMKLQGPLGRTNEYEFHLGIRKHFYKYNKKKRITVTYIGKKLIRVKTEMNAEETIEFEYKSKK